jgi:hypothetical protein
MRNHIRMLALGAAALALSTTAQAQGRGNGKGHDKGHEVVVQRSGGEVISTGRGIPPGLAKKPGQMPPGQYKKLYTTSQGASVLSDILRQRGYAVTRIVPAGQSQYVYYRLSDGRVRRAIVSPGTDQLAFSNLTSSLLQAVLSRLY